MNHRGEGERESVSIDFFCPQATKPWDGQGRVVRGTETANVKAHIADQRPTLHHVVRLHNETQTARRSWNPWHTKVHCRVDLATFNIRAILLFSNGCLAKFAFRLNRPDPSSFPCVFDRS